MNVATTPFGAGADRREGSGRGEPPVAADRPAARPRVAVEELFRGTREVTIVHGAEEYRLRLTRNGRLILTK